MLIWFTTLSGGALGLDSEEAEVRTFDGINATVLMKSTQEELAIVRIADNPHLETVAREYRELHHNHADN